MAKLYPTTIRSRFWAIVLDIIFIYITMLFLVPIFALSNEIPEWVIITFVFIYVLAIIFYFPVCETLMHGRSLGKLLVGIRVVSADGQPVNFAQSVQRMVMLPFDLLASSGLCAWICMIITPRNQRLGDMLANTIVVKQQPQNKLQDEVSSIYHTHMSPEEQDIYLRLATANGNDASTLASAYRDVQCELARLRTIKANPTLIEYGERILSSLHLQLFKRQVTTLRDSLSNILVGIPHAIYESRAALIASLVISLIAGIIGVYSQSTDPDFFSSIVGDHYVEMTIDNIESGNPMGVYSNESELQMTIRIFMNNFGVALRAYGSGIFILFGPLLFLITNFVMAGSFLTFFSQYDLLGASLITIHQHGILELSSIVITCGAALRLGTGWLFPGRMTRVQALVRSARQSMLIFLSTIPPLFVAACIEGFVTRHTEWPLSLRLSIITITTIIIIGYYVVLPIIAKHTTSHK